LFVVFLLIFRYVYRINKINIGILLKIQQTIQGQDISTGQRTLQTNIRRKITCTYGCIRTKKLLSNHKNSQKHLLKIGVLKYEFIDDNG
jgi:hypothetical protein